MLHAGVGLSVQLGCVCSVCAVLCTVCVLCV